MPPFLHDIDDISISAIPSSSATRLPAPDAMPQIDANWINMDIIQSWVRLCNDTHKCMEPSAFGSGPTWLIDVQQECLASAASLPADTHYCALSYVWGQAKTSKLTTGSAKAFQQPGALSGKQDAIVPTTIRHAIGLVRLLGERYLWVDAFCIAQDDEAHFHTELRNMGTIYNRAYLTIVAATAWDANDGLRGLMNVTPKRKLASNFADDLHKYLDPDYMIWYSRGWTFQEGQFSRRMLMFCDQTVVWRCGGCIIGETGPVQQKFVSHRSHLDWRLLLDVSSARDERLSPQETQLRRYFGLVSNYNIRNFTHPEDVPLAFEGIAHALVEKAKAGSIFEDGIHWGLPIAAFRDVITWTQHSEALRPRKAGLGFPSWSWFGSEGFISIDFPPGSLYSTGRLPTPLCDVMFDSSIAPPDRSRRGPGDRVVRILAETRTISSARVLTYPEPSLGRFWMYRDDGGEASDTTDAFKELELMAISRIWARSYARSGGNGEAFIRTLWIVRDADDIAYRRGVAFVEEGYWTTFAINGAGRQPIRLG